MTAREARIIAQNAADDLVEEAIEAVSEEGLFRCRCYAGVSESKLNQLRRQGFECIRTWHEGEACVEISWDHPGEK
jgi:hypothetical protein